MKDDILFSPIGDGARASLEDVISGLAETIRTFRSKMLPDEPEKLIEVEISLRHAEFSPRHPDGIWSTPDEYIRLEIKEDGDFHYEDGTV